MKRCNRPDIKNQRRVLVLQRLQDQLHGRGRYDPKYGAPELSEDRKQYIQRQITGLQNAIEVPRATSVGKGQNIGGRVMGIVHILKPDGTGDHYNSERAPSRERLQQYVEGDIEYVRVLFKDQPTYMVVNERGAVMDPPLPVNERATDIYHAASLAGRAAGYPGPRESWPKIHGVAVVLEGIHLD